MKSRAKSFEFVHLNREIGLVPAVMLVVGNTIGTGIFTTSGFIIKELRDPLALIFVWFLGGILSLFGALCYAELGKMFPRAGGEYVFLKESLGEVFGFLAGWISLIVGFSAPIAATAIAFSKHILEILGIGDFEKILKTIAILTILLLSLIHVQRVKVGANFQTGVTVFKLFFIISFLFLGLFFGKNNFNYLRIEDLGFDSFKEIFLNFSLPVSLIYVMYAYSGWNAVVYIGEEIKNPQRNIPVALISGTLLVMFLYLGLNFLYVTTLSVEEMGGVLEVGVKTAEKLFDENIALFFKVGITLGLISVLSAMILAGPRVYYAMARDGVFFKVFSKVNPDSKIPVFSILLQAGISIFMIITSSFEALLVYIGFTLSLCSSLVVIGLMKLKKKISLTGVIYVVTNFWMIGFSILTKPLTVLAGGLTIALGLFFYLTCFKKSFFKF